MSVNAPSAVDGLTAPLRGLKLLSRHRTLRRLAIAPLIVNSILFAIGIGVFVANFGDVLVWATAFLEIEDGSGFLHSVLSWLAGAARFLIGLVMALVFGVIVFFSFTLVGNLVAAPFNEVLSMKTEAIVLGRSTDESLGGLAGLYREALYAIGAELKRISLYLILMIPALALGLLLGVIPLIGPLLAPIAAFGVTTYFLAFDFTDPAMSRRKLSFRDKRRLLGTRRTATLGFGAAALGMASIPFLNLAILPVQVVTGTLLVVEWRGETADGAREGDAVE